MSSVQIMLVLGFIALAIVGFTGWCCCRINYDEAGIRKDPGPVDRDPFNSVVADTHLNFQYFTPETERLSKSMEARKPALDYMPRVLLESGETSLVPRWVDSKGHYVKKGTPGAIIKLVEMKARGEGQKARRKSNKIKAA